METRFSQPSQDNWLRSGNLTTGEHNKVIMPQLTYGLDVSQNGTKLAIHGSSNTFFLYDRVKRHTIRITEGKSSIAGADFHPIDNKHLATFATGGKIRIFEYSNIKAKLIKTIYIRNTIQRRFSNGKIRYNFDGTQIIFAPQTNSANPQGKAYVFDATTGKKTA